MKKLYTKEYVERIASREGFIKDNIYKLVAISGDSTTFNRKDKLKKWK